ncbi:MAG: polysaccharide biosynthesis/export family protein [Gemmatimonadota bacterium]|nr:polysaccharide biosynthesis/export family protein [Gemmatimonadota bacterium]
MTRAQLRSLLAEYENTAASSANSGAVRDRARTDAELIRHRLDAGDFQTGDQIVLTVEGEPTLTAAFSVEAGPALQLPGIGSIPLAGVLRSELQDHLRQQLARYLRDPVITARSSIRILVSGQVTEAGYKLLPTNTVISDVLSYAGGATSTADIPRIQIERGNEVIWDPAALQVAIVQGRTLDQMNLRAGDHLVVPVLRESTMSSVAKYSAVVIPVVLLIATLAGN